MSVYIDESWTPFKGTLYCHMIADATEELHSFAKSIGLKLNWFQDKPNFPHYDISKNKSLLAKQKGAIVISGKELLKRIGRIK